MKYIKCISKLILHVKAISRQVSIYGILGLRIDKKEIQPSSQAHETASGDA
jgi:hypothetical protein